MLPRQRVKSRLPLNALPPKSSVAINTYPITTFAQHNGKMLRQDFNRIDPKRRNVLDHRKKQFATPQYKDLDYPHRLNFYADAPTADITLEQFEQWAIDRLRGMSPYASGIVAPF